MEETAYLAKALSTIGMSGWGLSPTPETAGADALRPRSEEDLERFACVASMFVAYTLPPEADPLAGGEYDEAAFHEAVGTAIETGYSRVERLRAALDARGIANVTVPRGQDPDTLLGFFSQKRSAVLAGLGWIGRSSLFVTRRFGPRVTLFTVLVDVPAPKAVIPTQSCGECMECVRACGYGYLTGKAWRPGAHRRELVDAHSCSRKREELGVPVGRKDSCGRCLLACPLGGAPGS